jgi:hypothetical protein
MSKSVHLKTPGLETTARVNNSRMGIIYLTPLFADSVTAPVTEPRTPLSDPERKFT